MRVIISVCCHKVPHKDNEEVCSECLAPAEFYTDFWEEEGEEEEDESS